MAKDRLKEVLHRLEAQEKRIQALEGNLNRTREERGHLIRAVAHLAPAAAVGAGVGGGAGGKSVLERLVTLIPKPDIIVTAGTTWKELGFDDTGLTIFLQTKVRKEFKRDFNLEDAGNTVGDLAKAISAAGGGQ